MPNLMDIYNQRRHPLQCECVACLEKWAELWERVRALDRLALLDCELRPARPATPQEWAAFFDAEFPRVRHG